MALVGDRMARHAGAHGWKELRRALGIRRRVAFLESADVPMPLTWGILRPWLLLPEGARQWPPGAAAHGAASLTGACRAPGSAGGSHRVGGLLLLLVSYRSALDGRAAVFGRSASGVRRCRVEPRRGGAGLCRPH